MTERKFLEAIRYNKSIQKRIDININEEDEKYFHIYFNDNKTKEIENISLD